MMNNTMLDTLQSKHTTLDGLKMLMVTWNVNAKLEEAQNLRKLFFNPDEKCFGDTPEIIVLGLQEMVELSTSNVIGGSMVGNSAERVEQWRLMLLETLQAENRGFEMVTSKNMVGLWITVFALREVRVHISKIQTSSLGRGVGGVLGNKGAVYARFNVKDTSICLVCAHFAAHREHLQRRNEDFHAILNYKAFPGLLDSAGLTELTNLSPHSATAMANEAAKCGRMQERIAAMKRTLQSNRIPVSPSMNAKRESLSNFTSALDHDIIIWIGDLNYRLLGGMENSRIYDIIDGKRSYVLLDMDQLNLEREKGTVFEGFHEGIVSFDPTYKYVPGSTVGYNRERCPAWCDRVLWRLKASKTEAGDYMEMQSPFSGKSAGLSSPAAVGTPSGGPSAPGVPVRAAASIAVAEASVQQSDDESDDEDEQGCLPASTAVPASAVPATHASETSPPSEPSPPVPESAGCTAVETTEATPSAPPMEEESPPPAGSEETLSSAESAESTAGQEASAAEDSSLTVASDVQPVSPPRRPVSMSKAVFYKHTVPDSKVTEIVELMVYNRGENIISDHKPVRALMGIKYKKVDWAAHERHLVEHFTQRCAGRPYHSLSYRTAHGAAPVSASPRCVTMFSTLDFSVTQKVEVRNHSGSNTVRFEVSGSNTLPDWMSVQPLSGVIAPGAVAVLEMVCHSAEADRSYMKAIEEDALHLEDQLQPVWRRHLRNPDERGNPQLTAVLVLDLFTHLPALASSTAVRGSSSSSDSAKAVSGGAAGEGPVPMDTTGEVSPEDTDASPSIPVADAPAPREILVVPGAEEAACASPKEGEGSVDPECVWAMAPLLVPVICRVATA